MAAKSEDPTYSTLQAYRPQAQRVGSGIEATDTVHTASIPSPTSPSARSIADGLSELPSPEARHPDSGLVVTRSPHVTGSSNSSSAELFTQWTPGEKRSELPESTRRQRTICFLRPRYFWIALVASLVVVAMVVGAAVGATVHNAKNKTSTPVPPPLPSSNDTATTLSNQTGLASVSWNDTNQVTQHRIYYQDADGWIRESFWDVLNLTWVQNRNRIGEAKPNTPIAAAVAGSTNFRFQINLYALGRKNRILQWFTVDGVNWKIGTLTRTKVASSSSSLAATWHGQQDCLSCPNNFLLVYQGNNGKLQLGNATIGVSWDWSELQANPILGSGMSMALFWWPNATAGLRLFYQTNNLRMVSLDWDAANGNRSDATDLWVLKENDHIATIPSKAPIASFTWGSAPNGVPRILDTLSTGLGGITVNTWAGVKNAWVKTVSQPAMVGAQDSSIAANNNALAYAVMNNTIWEFGLKPNNRHWVLAGKVWP